MQPRKMQSLGQDVCHLRRIRNLIRPHFTVLNNFVGQLLQGVNVLGFVHEAAQKRPEVQNLTVTSQRAGCTQS